MSPRRSPVPPMPSRGRARGGGNGATVELLKVLLRAVAESERVAPKVLATVDDLEAIADDSEADVPALRGWRRRLFGDKALALKAGELGLSVIRGSVVVSPIAQPGEAGGR